MMITHPFNLQTSELTAYDFVKRLHQHLRMTHICIGYDFALGKTGGKSIPLQELEINLGIQFLRFPPKSLTGKSYHQA